MERWSAAGLVCIVAGVGWMLAQAGCAGGLRVPALGEEFGRSGAPPMPRTRTAAAPLPLPPPPAAADVAPGPDWVRMVRFDDARGVPATPWACDGKVSIEAPTPGGGNADAPKVAPGGPPAAGEDDAELFDVRTMLPWDPHPGADQAALPEEIRTRLHIGAPFDVSAVPLEPLRGPDSARARLARFVARAGTERMAVWGASHVAGEFFTGELRRILQDRWGDGGHGMLMPAPPWTGYRRSDINLCATGTWVTDFASRVGGRGDGLLAPTGARVEATSHDSAAWVQTTTSNPHGRAASRLGVLALAQPSGGTLEVRVDDVGPVRLETTSDVARPVPLRGLELRVPDGPHRLELRPAGDGPVSILGVVVEREAGFVLDAMGVTGRTAASWLAWDEALLSETLAWRRPGLVVLAYGTNEANDATMTASRYRTLLASVLAKMRRVLPDAACVLVGPSDRGKKLRSNRQVIWAPTAMIAHVQAEVAPGFDCMTWDLQAATGGPGSMFRWREGGLAAGDLIHFSAGGYQELARRWVAAMDEAVAGVAVPSPATRAVAAPPPVPAGSAALRAPGSADSRAR
jgi:lysophospholipase L1-like esterase